MKELKRILPDLIIWTVLIVLFITHSYLVLPAAIQLVTLKILLVSSGILHAHIVRKLLFPKVDWEIDKLKAKNYAALVFYIIIPLCYAFGG